ncbi:diguanylate cyclase [Novosphingobium sp. KN65.2]|uniref:sensor domain-containing diguanylate cyclase n=1 Tax=Novosphingobium sp. KN65.2 TaxID=1478134 RepID=UPI0005DBEF26|nr:diguanylate cyclase [Novosphingobium sp. KN65.2]CDO34922.1 putative Diguanylate kinase [Novosphingobium sp. KN65.2]
MVAKVSEGKKDWQHCVDSALIGALGYALLAWTTIYVTSDLHAHATMWPADAVILALLLKHPKRDWPYILLAGWCGNLIANVLTREWTPGLFLYGGINMGQTWLAAWLLLQVNKGDSLLDSARTVLGFVTCAGLVAPLVGAMAGTLVTFLSYGEDLGSSFLSWFLSNSLGYIVVTPFLKALFEGSYWHGFQSRGPTEKVEVLGLVGTHTLLTAFVFAQDNIPLLFLLTSSLLVLAFRHGNSSVMAGVIIIAVIGAVATIRGAGPIAIMPYSKGAQEFYFQFYLVLLLATVLPVATIVSSRKTVMHDLAEREEALRLMMSHSPDGILGFDVDGMCKWAEGPLRKYLGIEPGQMIGRSMDTVSPLAQDLVREMHRAARNDIALPGTFEFTPMLRPELVLEGSIGLLRRNCCIAGAVINLRDVTVRKDNEATLELKALKDDLTGLPNRQGLRVELEALAHSPIGSTSLAIVDVDCFKAINDAHGHGVGDVVLREIAQRMKRSMREGDFIARIGGDEFAILLHCDLETARNACQRIVESVRQTPAFSEDTVHILATVSCGVAEFRASDLPDQVFHAADVALYEMKRFGRNGVRAAA